MFMSTRRSEVTPNTQACRAATPVGASIAKRRPSVPRRARAACTSTPMGAVIKPRQEASTSLSNSLTMCVYGSLLPGLRNHHLLARARYLGPCETQPEYAMYDMGNTRSFPAVCTRGKTAIQGALYEVDAADLESIDRLEGHPRRYERQCVTLRQPQNQQAWMYILPRKQLDWGSKVVKGGNWRAHQRDPWANQRQPESY